MAKRNEKRLGRIEGLLVSLIEGFDKAKLYDYIETMANPKKLIRRSFIAGLMRGLGAAIGFSLLGAVVIILLQSLSESSVPLIAEFIKKIIAIVEK